MLHLRYIDGKNFWAQTHIRLGLGPKTTIKLGKKVRPDIYVKGGDYEISQLPEAEIVHSYGGKVVTVAFDYDRSTTKLLNKVRSK